MDNEKQHGCKVSGNMRKQSGKFGKGLCPHCYPMGGKRREIVIAATDQILKETFARANNIEPEDLDWDEDEMPMDDVWSDAYMALLDALFMSKTANPTVMTQNLITRLFSFGIIDEVNEGEE